MRWFALFVFSIFETMSCLAADRDDPFSCTYVRGQTFQIDLKVALGEAEPSDLTEKTKLDEWKKLCIGIGVIDNTEEGFVQYDSGVVIVRPKTWDSYYIDLLKQDLCGIAKYRTGVSFVIPTPTAFLASRLPVDADWKDAQIVACN